MFLAILDGSCRTSGQTLDTNYRSRQSLIFNLKFPSTLWMVFLLSLKSGVGHKSWKMSECVSCFLVGIWVSAWMGFLHVGHHGGIGQPRPGYKSDHLRRFWGVKVAGGSPPLTKADVEEQETPPENHHDVRLHLILKNGDHWKAFHVYLFEKGTKTQSCGFLRDLAFPTIPQTSLFHCLFKTFDRNSCFQRDFASPNLHQHQAKTPESGGRRAKYAIPQQGIWTVRIFGVTELTRDWSHHPKSHRDLLNIYIASKKPSVKIT